MEVWVVKMNADTLCTDVSECMKFAKFWMEVTEVQHLTLTSIIPDGTTSTQTFALDAEEKMADWISTSQAAGRNIYFTPNETPPGCHNKPTKAAMPAAVSRFADIDPLDDEFPLADERDRLHRLAEHLCQDPDAAPTVIIDSGNGLQPIWAVVREQLDSAAIERIEGETKALEIALGAGGTHNIDRLLRLPGTLNFPNKTKQSKGRGVSRARLIFTAPNLYQTHQAAALAKHIANKVEGTDLIRLKATKDGRPSNSDDSRAASGDAAVRGLMADMKDAGAERIFLIEDLAPDLQTRLQKAMLRKPRLADRWAGLVDDMTEAGRDASRSGADLSVAAMVKAAGLSHLETALILCAFPHGKANNTKWVTSGMRLRECARNAINSFEPKQKRQLDDNDPVGELVAEFNEKYMVVCDAGKTLIFKPAYEPILKRSYFERIEFGDFSKTYLNRSVLVGVDKNDNEVYSPAATVWLKHPDRKQYIGGVIFDPSGRRYSGDTLNLWRGFAVQPKPGSWERLKTHIHRNICNSDQTKYDYLMNWICRLVQRPAEQGEVAVVMQGGEGTGKGTLARVLRNIFGQHGMAVSNHKHLTGNFNGHLRDCVFLFADEAFYAGDPSHVGVLKSIITEPHLTIEAKYANAVQMPNFLHLMMASNEEWVVPVSLDARRFLVLEVSDAEANNTEYFAAIWKEMESGGYEAMLYELMNHDITHFNVRRVPVTEGLQQQKKLSLGTSEGWWLDALHRGYVFKSKLGLEDYFGEWQDHVTTDVLFASYGEYAKYRNERHPMARETFGRFMLKMGGSAERTRNAVVGEHIADVATPYGTTRKGELVHKDRATGYHFGNLSECREAFIKATNLTVEWDGGAKDDEAQPG